jgi:ABC transporter substrate binding protein
MALAAFVSGINSCRYWERLLKGTNPADLPVEQPAKVELLVNLQTAKMLGIEVPLSLLIRLWSTCEPFAYSFEGHWAARLAKTLTVGPVKLQWPHGRRP